MKMTNLSTRDFTENKRVLKILSDLKRLRERDPSAFVFSDVKDDEGNYYVDLVQEGGGVLGIALVGYTFILEQMGIRFVKMAGTSAGAINTLLMAATDKPQQTKSGIILKELIHQDLSEFVDGDSDVKELVEAMNSKAGKLKLLFKGAQVVDNIRNDLGLNPGHKFEEWLEHTLKEYGVITSGDLTRKMHDLPPEVLEQIYPDETQPKPTHIALIAADLTTETKVNFPDMAELYFNNFEGVNPARFARASMSVPIFFQPMTVDIPQTERVKNLWIEKAQYFGRHPKQVKFVDGGILSNFPINIFHVHDRMPRRPTFGVRLGFDRMKCNENNKGVLPFLFSCFDAARLMSDREFIFKNPDFKHIVTSIDIKDHDWLNFNLSDEAKVDLFIQGAIAASDFLRYFNWEVYKEKRRAKALASIARDDLKINLQKLLKKAEKARNIDLSNGPEREVLVERLKFLPDHEDFNILWIDDKSRREQVLKKNELGIIEAFAGKIEWVGNSKNALFELQNKEVTYDLIISDIKRENNSKAGLEFFDHIRDLYQRKELNNLPPIIFYITNYDPQLGVPPYVFGITNSPLDLIHLVADIYQRSGKGISPNLNLENNFLSGSSEGIVETKSDRTGKNRMDRFHENDLGTLDAGLQSMDFGEKNTDSDEG